MKPVELQQILDVLNRAVKADQIAVTALMETRLLCNDKLADDPTIQVVQHEYTGTTVVGLLGIINGLCGIRPDGYGYITAVYDEGGLIVQFEETDR